MRVNSILDLAGAIILLAIIATVASKPKIVGEVTGGFVSAIKAAKG